MKYVSPDSHMQSRTLQRSIKSPIASAIGKWRAQDFKSGGGSVVGRGKGVDPKLPRLIGTSFMKGPEVNEGFHKEWVGLWVSEGDSHGRGSC